MTSEQLITGTEPQTEMEAGEMIGFRTNDRTATGFDGSKQSIPWSAILKDYRKNDRGILQPTVFQAVWYYPEADLVYFDGKILSLVANLILRPDF